MRRMVLLFAVRVLAASLAAGSGDAVQPSFTGSSVVIRAADVAFEPTEITLPSGTPLRIVLDNQDSGIPHSVRVFQGDHEFGGSQIVTGPGQTEVRFGPLAPGHYEFGCEVHPDMMGTLIITP